MRIHLTTRSIVSKSVGQPVLARRFLGLLKEYGLSDDNAALTELIRIDIELRYRHGFPIKLADYFDQFGDLLAEPHHVAQIAFEDYRSRAAHGHPVHSARWRELPGIGAQRWYQQLSEPEQTSAWGDDLGTPDWSRVDDPSALTDAMESIGFRLVHELGRGAFSRVYMATQRDLAERPVVLKVVQQTLAEPQSMALLQHTNIVPIFSFHRVNSLSVICMPYAGGTTLADFLRGEDGRAGSRGGLDLISTVRNQASDTVLSLSQEVSQEPSLPEQHVAFALSASVSNKPLEKLRQLTPQELAVWIFRRLASALAHSHARGVLHGDLKPANVLIRNDGEPALLDFNLSQTLDREQLQHVGGTLPYMPPESYRALMGQTTAPHVASDIYALGVMLFEVVTGRLPFASPSSTAESDLKPAIEIRSALPDWRLEDDVSPSLQAIIDRCLQPLPEHRYQAAEQLEEDLRREQASLPLKHAREPFSVRFRKWVRRHPKLVSGGSVGLLLMAMLIPVLCYATYWREQSLHAAMLERFERFESDSTRSLASLLSDPPRHREEGIAPAMGPFEEFSLLDEGLQSFDSPLVTKAQLARARSVSLRYVLQLAIAECDWLRARNELPIDPATLTRLDQLIAAAIRCEAGRPSRARMQVQAERARLMGEPEAADHFSRSAQQIAIQDDDTERYLGAVRMMNQRRWSQAERELTALADRGTIPSSLRWTALGLTQVLAGDNEGAKLSFTQAIGHIPKTARIWRLRARCYMHDREYRKAEQDFSAALQLDPKFSNGWANRGVCRAATGQPKLALADFDQALALQPDNVHALLLRHRVLLKLGRKVAAERDYQRALEVAHPAPAALQTRSLARRRKGDLKGALEDLQRCYESDRDNPLLLEGMAHVLTKMKRPDEALESLSRAIELDPGRENTVINRAVLLARSGREQEALRDCELALQGSNAPRVLYQTACVHALLKDAEHHQLALAYLSEALQAGFGADAFASDRDLDAVRGHEGFQSLMQAIELSERLTQHDLSRSQSP